MHGAAQPAVCWGRLSGCFHASLRVAQLRPPVVRGGHECSKSSSPFHYFVSSQELYTYTCAGTPCAPFSLARVHCNHCAYCLGTSQELCAALARLDAGAAAVGHLCDDMTHCTAETRLHTFPTLFTQSAGYSGRLFDCAGPSEAAPRRLAVFLRTCWLPAPRNVSIHTTLR